MGEIKKRLPLKCPACDAPLREIHFGPAPNPVWLVLCGRASDGVAVVSYVWGIERSGFFNGREKWAKGFENQRV